MALINDLQSVHSVEVEESEFLVNDIKNIPVIEHGQGLYSILIDNTMVWLELVAASEFDRTFSLKIDHLIYDTLIVRKIDQVVASMGFENNLIQKIECIGSPMPGLIKKVLVSKGDQVIIGQPLIILEAMKMENIIKSPIDGRIKTILFEAGDAVNKSVILIRFGI